MKEIIAKDIYGTPYMTQSADVEIVNRVFCTRCLGRNVQISDWRGATEEEKLEWKKAIEDMYLSEQIIEDK